MQKIFQLWDVNIGVLYVSAISSVAVIGTLMAGWASNNKYSLLGAMRSGAQIVSYELSAGISIISIVVLTGSLQMSAIVQSQQNGWWLFKGHIPAMIAFIIFIIAVTAETNRAPFDLAEAESELTAGFHTEYSGMKFALFFLAEYVNIFYRLQHWRHFYSSVAGCLFILATGRHLTILWIIFHHLYGLWEKCFFSSS